MDELNNAVNPEPEEEKARPGVITDPVLAFAYLFSGYSFTLVSKKSGDRFTFKLEEAPKRATDPVDAPPVYFVKLMNGPNNETDYAYFGFIKGGKFIHGGAKACAGKDAPSVKGFKFTFEHLTKKHMPEQLEFFHEGHCGRCGRKLTVDESVACGFGPECRTKAAGFEMPCTMPPINAEPHKVSMDKPTPENDPVGRFAPMNGKPFINYHNEELPAVVRTITPKPTPAEIEEMIEWMINNNPEYYHMDGEMQDEKEARKFWTNRFRTNPLDVKEMNRKWGLD